MTVLSRYNAKLQELEAIKSEISQIESNPSFKKEIEFKQSLENLMSEHNRTARQVLEVLASLDPSVSTPATGGRPANTRRKLVTYKNPHTGEVVETRGGNHKTLKEWREEFGKDEVNSWKS